MHSTARQPAGQAFFDLHDSLPLLQPHSCGVRKPLEADLAGEGALREEQAVPVEFCPGG